MDWKELKKEIETIAADSVENCPEDILRVFEYNIVKLTKDLDLSVSQIRPHMPLTMLADLVYRQVQVGIPDPPAYAPDYAQGTGHR